MMRDKEISCQVTADMGSSQVDVYLLAQEPMHKISLLNVARKPIPAFPPFTQPFFSFFSEESDCPNSLNELRVPSLAI